MSTWSARVLREPAEWDEPALRTRWASLAAGSPSLHRVYASPEWFDGMRAAEQATDLAIVVVQDRSGQTAGVVPVRRRQVPLTFDISSHALFSARFSSVEVLGTTPLAPAASEVYAVLLDAFTGIWPGTDAVYFDTLPIDEPLHEYLSNLQGGRFAYQMDGRRPWFLLDLPDSAEAFLASLGSKSRGTLKRKTKKLGEKAGGARILRVDTREAVPAFLVDAAAISRKSWQYRVLGPRIVADEPTTRLFQAYADNGLLRAYVMYSGDLPCAFVVGYQAGGVFQYAELGFDADWAALSPGTVLLFLLIQDLCSHQRPRTLNFGMGDAEYKRRFSNVERVDESLLVLPASARARAVALAHRSFRGAVRTVRRFVKKDHEKPAEERSAD